MGKPKHVYLVFRLFEDGYEDELISATTSLCKAKKAVNEYFNNREPFVWKENENHKRSWFGKFKNSPVDFSIVYIWKVYVKNPYFFSFIKEEN